jgi:hypothetical protein
MIKLKIYNPSEDVFLSQNMLLNTWTNDVSTVYRTELFNAYVVLDVVNIIVHYEYNGKEMKFKISLMFVTTTCAHWRLQSSGKWRRAFW